MNKSSEFERLLRYRGDAGPSSPAAGHTSLQTRAQGPAGGPLLTTPRCAVGSAGLDLCEAFPRAFQVLTFLGSKAQKPLHAAKLAPGLTPPRTITPVGWEVLWFRFMGMGWVTGFSLVPELNIRKFLRQKIHS